MKLRSFSVLMAALATIVSCTQELELIPDSKGLVDIESVSMIAHNFSFEDTPTKTQISPSAQGMTFSWSSNDVVGVFPNNGKGTQVKFPIADGDVQGGSNTSNANFTGNGWAVMKAEDYSSYYPFVPDMDLDMTSIPVTYLNQVQIGSGTTGHLTSYDYMVTAPTPPSNNGEIAFDFQHMGVILQLEMVVPKPAEYTTLTLSCEGKPFISSGTIDITQSTPTITPNAWTDEFEIQLENFVTTEKNQTIVVNLLIAPDDFSGKQIKVKLQGPHASFVTHFNRPEGKPYKPGSASHPTLGTLEGGDVNMIEHGEQFNKDIKTLVNGEEYILEKKDYLIRHIVFQANANADLSLPHVDVSDQTATSPIYASWDESSNTIYVTSADAHVYGGSSIAHMFANLVNLQSIDFTDFSTEYTTSIVGAFRWCEKLPSLDLSSWELSGIIGMHWAFEGCHKLESITWPAGKTFSKEYSFQTLSMFEECRSLSHIDLSVFNGCKIHNSMSMFHGCSTLTDIDMSLINMSECGEYASMFEGCQSLTELDVHHFGWSNTGGDRICWTFANCTSLESINLGDFYIPNVYRAEGVFEGCSSLKDLTYTRFEVDAENYGAFFAGCSALETIDVSGFVTSKAKSISGMFWGCSSLSSIDLSNWNTSNVENMANLFIACNSLTAIDISNFSTYNVENMLWLFFQCSNLTSVVYGSNFNTENVTDMNGMFAGCEKMTSLDFSKFSTGKVLDFAYMLDGCTALESITWGNNFDTHYAEYFAGMFHGCSSLKQIDLSFFDMRSATGIAFMFANCDNLEKLNLSSFDTDHIENVSELFSNCNKLNELWLNPNYSNAAGDLSAYWEAVAGLASNIINVNVGTIYCSEDFMNLCNSRFDSSNITWKDATTGDVMTPQAQ